MASLLDGLTPTMPHVGRLLHDAARPLTSPPPPMERRMEPKSRGPERSLFETDGALPRDDVEVVVGVDLSASRWSASSSQSTAASL